MKNDEELLKAAETIATYCCLTDDIECYDCFFSGEDKNGRLCCMFSSFAPFEWNEQLKVLKERSKDMINKAEMIPSIILITTLGETAESRRILSKNLPAIRQMAFWLFAKGTS